MVAFLIITIIRLQLIIVWLFINQKYVPLGNEENVIGGPCNQLQTNVFAMRSNAYTFLFVNIFLFLLFTDCVCIQLYDCPDQLVCPAVYLCCICLCLFKLQLKKPHYFIFQNLFLLVLFAVCTGWSKRNEGFKMIDNLIIVLWFTLIYFQIVGKRVGSRGALLNKITLF